MNKKKVIITSIICVVLFIILGLLLFFVLYKKDVGPFAKIEEPTYKNFNFAFKYTNGRFDLAFDDKTIFQNAETEFKLKDRIISSTEYETFKVEKTVAEDTIGKGEQLTIVANGQNLPTLKTKFTFYNNKPFFLVSAGVFGNKVETNYIAPILIKNHNIQTENPNFNTFVEVPFDNDQWVSYEAHSIEQNGLSHEVGCFFNSSSKNALIIGSLSHDTWKSAISYETQFKQIKTMKVYSGANTKLTRDESPHGTVTGTEVESSTFLFGFFDDWQEGMNEYAKTNTKITPKRETINENVPIGWNSWGVVQTNLSYDIAVNTSDYIHNNLQDTWKDKDNIVYVNLDSWWDNMSDNQLRDFVAHCKSNGQEAGIYSCPFVVWLNADDIKTWEIANGVKYEEVILKKADGTPYGNNIDGCFPMDVTHPVVINHYTSQLKRLVNLGFKYIKMDFLVHAALEGQHYNPEIQTGIQAYNFAMKKVCEIVGDDVYINLSMAPLFPYNYANGRRLSCDTFYNIDNTKYVLNALTYGFWQAELFDDIDPDHIVLWGSEGQALPNEAKSRMLSGIICGGSFLAGDNFSNPTAAADLRFKELLTNKNLINVLKIGKPFKAEMNGQIQDTSNMFVLEHKNKKYVAIFNYSKTNKESHEINVGSGKIKDLFTNANLQSSGGVLKITLEPRDCILIEISN